MSKTTLQRIESVTEQIQQLESQKKKLMQEQKERERKARTKRLIERGAILESLIDEADTLTNDQVNEFLKQTIQTQYAYKILADLKAPKAEKPSIHTNNRIIFCTDLLLFIESYTSNLITRL